MAALFQDLRYALRLLRRNPSFGILVILTLGLGMGANTALFSVGSVRHTGLDTEPAPELYIPWLEHPNGWASLTFVVRVETDQQGLGRTLQSRDRTPVPGVKISGVRTLDEYITLSVREPRFRTLLFSLLGALVLVLTVVGVAALTAHTVAHRTREIGIRVALGAAPRQVLSLMLGQSVKSVTIGIAAGLIAAWWTTKLLERFLFEVPARDPVAFGGSAALLLVAALAAAWLPARRALRIDPAETLRHE